MSSEEYKPDDYTSGAGEKENIPVTGDNETVEDPVDAEEPNSDKALEADEAAAIDQSNIVEGRTRGAAKPSGTYREPGDEEGIPADDGTSQ